MKLTKDEEISLAVIAHPCALEGNITSKAFDSLEAKGLVKPDANGVYWATADGHLAHAAMIATAGNPRGTA